MDEERRTEEFLTLFKRLEKLLVSLSGIKDEGFVSFSRALNALYYEKENPVISNYETYSFLRSASDVRNLLSHEIQACVPTEEFVKKMKTVLERLEHPVNILDVSTRKILSCCEEEQLFHVMERMNASSLSHLPIMKNGRIQGVFSRSTLFDAMTLGLKYSSDSKIKEFSQVTALEKHLNEAFLFVPVSMSVDKVFRYLSSRDPKKKNVACIYVTEHGKREEEILGVCTLSDLTGSKAKLY